MKESGKKNKTKKKHVIGDGIQTDATVATANY